MRPFSPTTSATAPSSPPPTASAAPPSMASPSAPLAPGNIPALYMGLSSFAGVYIVGFQIPADFANGHRKLQIAVNGIASPTGVVIPIIRADTRFRPVSA
ncbi:MAG: hypothetical protein INH43_20730 [Acidobacteriaceae bacterium]|nr:hypothetical protein [Acidobacteriaceae bacterium]